MIHPHTELRFISPEIGYGVVATALIPKGTITWVLDDLDREFTPEQFNQLAPRYQSILDTYSFRNNQGNLVLCWDHARFVNHSFNANCLTTAYDFEIAIRDILPGEQITDDYGYLNITTPFRGVEEGTRRKVVYPDDLLKYHRIWDKKIWSALVCLPKVGQPLREMLSEEKWERVNRVIRKEETMDSILSCYFDPHMQGPNSNGHRPV